VILCTIKSHLLGCPATITSTNNVAFRFPRSHLSGQLSQNSQSGESKASHCKLQTVWLSVWLSVCFRVESFYPSSIRRWLLSCRWTKAELLKILKGGCASTLNRKVHPLLAGFSTLKIHKCIYCWIHISTQGQNAPIFLNLYRLTNCRHTGE
jgi:hypothetical protein